MFRHLFLSGNNRYPCIIGHDTSNILTPISNSFTSRPKCLASSKSSCISSFHVVYPGFNRAQTIGTIISIEKTKVGAGVSRVGTSRIIRRPI